MDLDFVNSELDIIKFWDDNDLFNTSLKLSEDKPRYVFYDGPPLLLDCLTMVIY